MKIKGKHIIVTALAVIAIALTIYIWQGLPVVSGYAAETVCSGVFVSGRAPGDISRNELGSFPLSLASFNVDMEDSSVTASVFGLAGKKAVFRRRLGATLLNGITENALRKQTIVIPPAPVIDQDTLDWPQGNRLNSPLSVQFDRLQLDSAVAEAFENRKTPIRRTRAVIVVYDGQIIAEKYAPGYSCRTKFDGFSMAKSITNALIGILVRERKLDVNKPAPVDQWSNDDRRQITIAHLMQMNSGLRWWEYPYAASDFTKMLFNEKSMAAYAVKASLKDKPGTVFNYSSGSASMLAYLIRKTVGDSDYYGFPYRQLFYKIGMYNTVIAPDAGGTFSGANYCFATARDWARFGLLYLNDGIWNGERILPRGWVGFTTTPSPAKTHHKHGEYGALWWINSGNTDSASGKTYPDVPADCFSCQGYFGQYVWVIPSKKLVVVKLSHEEGYALNSNRFLADVIRSLKN